MSFMFTKVTKKSVIIFVAASFAAINVLLVSLVIIFGTLTWFYDRPEAQAIADRNQKNLEQEFREVAPLSQAVVIQQGSMHKIRHGVVSSAYQAAESYESIKQYYGHELKSRGWNFSREGVVLFAGTDYGGKELVYCKNGYAASLQYAGRQEAEFGWTFSFGMTWGLADECK